VSTRVLPRGHKGFVGRTDLNNVVRVCVHVYRRGREEIVARICGATTIYYLKGGVRFRVYLYICTRKCVKVGQLAERTNGAPALLREVGSSVLITRARTAYRIV